MMLHNAFLNSDFRLTYGVYYLTTCCQGMFKQVHILGIFWKMNYKCV